MVFSILPLGGCLVFAEVTQQKESSLHKTVCKETDSSKTIPKIYCNFFINLHILKIYKQQSRQKNKNAYKARYS